jgi:Ca-activated chloride channel family protein
MIFFAHPEMLVLLVFPVVLAFWQWTRRGRPVVMPMDGVVKKRGYVLMFLLHAASVLPSLLLAAAVVLLASPMRNSPPQVERQMTNIQIVLDNSGSMAYEYGVQPGGSAKKHTRFDAAMDGIDQFLEMRRGDAFGLTVYAKYYLHWVPLTLDTSAISLSRPFIVPYDYSIRGWQPGYTGWEFGGTFTASALLGAIDVLKQRPQGDRMIVLVTDGEADRRDLNTARLNLVISELRKAGVSCFAIYINEKAAPRNLKRICSETGGQLIEVNDERSLVSVFEHIDAMKKVSVKRKEPLASENFMPVIIAALAIFILHLGALFGLRYTPW